MVGLPSLIGNHCTIVDTSAFGAPQNGDKSLSRIVREEGINGLIKRHNADPEFIEKQIDVIEFIRRTKDVYVINEVFRESRAGLIKLNMDLDSMNSIYNLNRNDKKEIRKTRRFFRENGVDVESPPEVLGSFESFLDSYSALLRNLSGYVVSCDDFSARDKIFYKAVMKMCRKGDNSESGLSLKPGFGDGLETDNRIIATSIVLSDSYPVILLTQDHGIMKKSYKVQRAMRMNCGRLNSKGKQMTCPKHSVNAMDIESFRLLESKNVGLI